MTAVSALHARNLPLLVNRMAVGLAEAKRVRRAAEECERRHLERVAEERAEMEWAAGSSTRAARASRRAAGVRIRARDFRLDDDEDREAQTDDGRQASLPRRR